MGTATRSLGGLFLLSNSRKLAYREAAKKFRDTIGNAISDLKNSTVNPVDILEHGFQNHEKAFIELSKHLLFKKSFNSAWEKYAYHHDSKIRFLEAYSSAGVSVEVAKNNRALAIERLEKLINYAKP